MKNSLLISLVTLGIFFGTGCKSEFERMRTSGDPAAILAQADTYFETEEYLKAQTLYELVISSFRGLPQAELISYNYAYSYYHMEQYILAAHYFKNFANTYGASQHKEEAEFMHAYSNYKLSPTFRLDQSYSLKAIEALQEFINQHPSSDRLTECNDLIDEMRLKLEIKAFEGAVLYYDIQQYQAAIRSFENILIEYPDTKQAEEVRFLAVESAFLLAKNSFVEKQLERYENVIKRGDAFINRYKSSDNAIQVQKMLSDSQKRLKQLDNVRYKDQSSGTRS